MVLSLLLLLLGPGLGPGLGPAAAQELNLRAVVHRNYDMAKVSGVWYSISMASDDMKRISEDGDLRVYIQNIKILDNGSLKFSFRVMVLGQCEHVAIVCDKTEKNGEYALAYEGDNRVVLWETDYQLYATFYLHNVRNGTETRVLALYGRVPELGHSFLHRFAKVCRKYGLGPQNIISLANEDLCIKAEG